MTWELLLLSEAEDELHEELATPQLRLRVLDAMKAALLDGPEKNPVYKPPAWRRIDLYVPAPRGPISVVAVYWLDARDRKNVVPSMRIRDDGNSGKPRYAPKL